MRRVTYLDRRPQQGVELACLQAHWDGIPTVYIAAARDGINPRCVDCQSEPMAGGLRCATCFATTVQRRKASA